jgi:cyanophycinase-like exopeptidase
MPGPVYLAATGDAVLTKLASRAYEELRKKKPRVAVTYAPVAGSTRGLKFMSERMPKLFPHAIVERFAVEGERGAQPVEDALAVVGRADLVFVSGGDPVLGAKILASAGASVWLREAHARGVPTMGVSAGAIALGAWWADWPDDDDGDAEEELDRTALLPCIGVLADCVFDTHNEEDDWDELRAVAKLAAREKKRARFLGIPSGGALVFHADGAMEVVGKPPFELR